MSGYLELILVSIIFSFGGSMVKAGKEMCGPETISFLRFFLGAFFLFLLMIIKKKKIRVTFLSKWILLGAGFKSLHYFCENYGLAKGTSFGNIVITPATTVLIALVSVFWLKEKYTKRTLIATIFCLLGVLLISWNGMSLADFVGKNLWITIVFMLGAVGNAGFTIVQKQLLSVMDTYESMLSMFILGAVFLIFPAATSGTYYMEFHWSAFGGILGLGIITGVTFLMISDSLRTVPLHLVPLIQSITVVLAVIWGILFWGEPVTVSVIVGTILSLGGVIMLKSK